MAVKKNIEPIILDQPGSLFARINQYLKRYWKWVLGLCFAVFISGLGVYIYYAYQGYYHMKAFEKLYLAHTTQDYQDVIDQYQGTVADEMAYFEQIKAFLEKEEKAEAKTMLELYQTLYPDSFFVPYAMLSLAALNEDEKQMDEAVKIYQQLLDTKAFAYAWNSANFSLCALLIEQGHLDEARIPFASLKENAKSPAWADRIAVLEESFNQV